MKRPFIVAIDGPAGAGKSSVSKLLARRLNFSLVDTGAIYRCVALRAIREGFRYIAGVPWLWITICLFAFVLMLQWASIQVLARWTRSVRV